MKKPPEGGFGDSWCPGRNRTTETRKFDTALSMSF